MACARARHRSTFERTAPTVVFTLAIPIFTSRMARSLPHPERAGGAPRGSSRGPAPQNAPSVARRSEEGRDILRPQARFSRLRVFAAERPDSLEEACDATLYSFHALRGGLQRPRSHGRSEERRV